MLIMKGQKQIFEVPSIEINDKISNLGGGGGGGGGPLGPQIKFPKGPIGSSGAWGPKLWPLELCDDSMIQLQQNHLQKHWHSSLQPGIGSGFKKARPIWQKNYVPVPSRIYHNTWNLCPSTCLTAQYVLSVTHRGLMMRYDG